ncbi:MAG: L-threonylcarbamoyladenylate synthase [Thermodesulfobacteriota bacterium]
MKTGGKKPLILLAGGDFAPAVMALRRGGIVAYPTETFYGLGVNALNPKAVEKLFVIKGRPPEKPITLIIKDRKELKGITPEVPADASLLIDRYWPGPLTLVLKASKEIPLLVTAGTGTIGARVSSNPTAQRLAFEFGSPITATSANPSTQPPAKDAATCVEYFNGTIDVVIDGGTLGAEKGSTIVDATGTEIKLIREGVIPFEEIAGFLRTQK